MVRLGLLHRFPLPSLPLPTLLLSLPLPTLFLSLPPTQLSAQTTQAPKADSEPSSQGRRTFTNRNRSFRISLPESWRLLTPDEARQLRPQLPKDLARDLPVPGRFYRLANVDGWLAGKLDGPLPDGHRGEGGSQRLDQETMARVRLRAKALSQGGELSYEILEIRQAKLGKDLHPAIECQVRMTGGEGMQPARSLEFLVPTGGNCLRFSFRAPEKGFDRALPGLRQLASSLAFSRPPAGSEGLSSKLMPAIIIGSLVGLMLLLLRWWTKR